MAASQIMADEFYARIVTAAGIDPLALSASGQKTLRWLSLWDEPTTAALEELLLAVRADAGAGE